MQRQKIKLSLPNKIINLILGWSAGDEFFIIANLALWKQARANFSGRLTSEDVEKIKAFVQVTADS